MAINTLGTWSSFRSNYFRDTSLRHQPFICITRALENVASLQCVTGYSVSQWEYRCPSQDINSVQFMWYLLLGFIAYFSSIMELKTVHIVIPSGLPAMLWWDSDLLHFGKVTTFRQCTGIWDVLFQSKAGPSPPYTWSIMTDAALPYLIMSQPLLLPQSDTPSSAVSPHHIFCSSLFLFQFLDEKEKQFRQVGRKRWASPSIWSLRPNEWAGHATK